MTTERSGGSLLPRAFAEVLSDLADLVRKEVRLAKAELSAKLSNKLRAGIWMSTAAGLALVAVILFAQALILWIAAAFGISIHLSCLIVAVRLRGRGISGLLPRPGRCAGRANAHADYASDRTGHNHD